MRARSAGPWAAEQHSDRMRALRPWPSRALGLHRVCLALGASSGRLVCVVMESGRARAERMHGRDGLYSVAP